jgi:hypothetical protein
MIVVELRRIVGNQEAKVQIAQVVVYRATTRYPTHYLDVVLLNKIYVYFFINILVLAHYHRWLVYVKHQVFVIGGKVAQDVFFNCQIYSWVINPLIINIKHKVNVCIYKSLITNVGYQACLFYLKIGCS